MNESPRKIESLARQDLAKALQEQIRRWERRPRPTQETVACGCPGLDRLLTDGGFGRGTLVEWLSVGRGGGAATLALAVAKQVCQQTETPDSRLPSPDLFRAGALVVVDRPRKFYPPAAAGWGLDWQWCVVVRPRDDRDEGWALDQTLRSAGVGAMLCWPQKLNQRRFRRLQLAAETGGTLGLIVRDEKARREPSWAQLRLLVTPVRDRAASAPSSRGLMGGRGLTGRRRLRVEIVHAQAGRGSGAIELELDEQTGGLYEPSTVAVAPPVATPAIERRSTGA